MTQFEADTAAAFVALAAARVDVGVIEAGLGGRLDATNVLPSRVTVLTSVGLEHTEYLGDTEVEIAAEKLAVLRDHTTLVLGPVSAEVCGARAAHRRRAPGAADRRPRPGAGRRPCRRRRPYLRRNFAVALAAADAMLGSLDPERVAEVAAGLELHGRMEVIEGDPLTVLDAAHNPAGAAALAEALPAVAGGRPVIACLAVLADKDAEAIVGALAPVARGRRGDGDPGRAAGAGRAPGRADARGAAPWRTLAREAGIGWVEEVADPAAAVARARSVAHAQGGVLLVTGSHYLLRYAGVTSDSAAGTDQLRAVSGGGSVRGTRARRA